MAKKFDLRRTVNIILISFIGLVFFACAVHVSVAYVYLLKANAETATSFPPYAAVIYAIPYASAVFVAGVILLAVNIVYACKKEKSK